MVTGHDPIIRRNHRSPEQPFAWIEDWAINGELVGHYCESNTNSVMFTIHNQIGKLSSLGMSSSGLVHFSPEFRSAVNDIHRVGKRTDTERFHKSKNVLHLVNVSHSTIIRIFSRPSKPMDARCFARSDEFFITPSEFEPRRTR